MIVRGETGSKEMACADAAVAAARDLRCGQSEELEETPVATPSAADDLALAAPEESRRTADCVHSTL